MLFRSDGRHVVIRPLAYVHERDLAEYAELKQFPIIPCDLCGSQATLQRKQMKELMRDWEKRFPGRVDSIFRAMQDVRPSHLMDRGLFDFAGIAPTGEPRADGDKAFDPEDYLQRIARSE